MRNHVKGDGKDETLFSMGKKRAMRNHVKGDGKDETLFSMGKKSAMRNHVKGDGKDETLFSMGKKSAMRNHVKGDVLDFTEDAYSESLILEMQGIKDLFILSRCVLLYASITYVSD